MESDVDYLRKEDYKENQGWAKEMRVAQTTLSFTSLLDEYGGKVIKVLDIGCGTGEFGGFQVFDTWELYGLDLTEHKLVCEAYKEVRIGDMHKIPYDDGFFDVVWIAHTLEHAISPYVLLCEINRVLKQDGYVVVVVPAEGDYKTCMPGHYFVPTMKQLGNLLHQTNFEFCQGKEYTSWFGDFEPASEFSMVAKKKGSFKDYKWMPLYPNYIYKVGMVSTFDKCIKYGEILEYIDNDRCTLLEWSRKLI